MINREVAKVLAEIGDLLEITGADAFRVNAYRRASRAIDESGCDLADLANRNQLQTIPGVGKGTADRIMQYLKTGQIELHQELLASIPAGLPELLAIPGLGPKKVRLLYESLSVGGMQDLRESIAAGKVESLSGFGKRSVEKIVEGMAFLERSAGRTPLGVALPIAEALCDEVAELTGVKAVEIAGSARRGRETVGDLDLVCVADDGEPVVKAFTQLPTASGIRAAGGTKGSILVAIPGGREIQVDLRVVSADSFGAAMQYFTGSKEHNVRLRELAVKKGWKLNEYGLFDGKKLLAGKNEDGIYRKLGLAPVPPELREDRGEIEARGKWPDLIEMEDIRGDLHVHTTGSDGRNTIEEMARAARAMGYGYLGFAEHSRSSAIANGLSVDDLYRHVENIRSAGKKLKGITLLAGIECDILSDGSLDYPDDVLAQLDWVVASIHAGQQQDRRRLTKRSIGAMENPYVCALGHPSGRLLGKRDAMDIDFEQVVAAAARTGTALELNASWQRLDLKDVHVRQAMDAGCWVVINTDAHSDDQLGQMRFGVQTARRGWATKNLILNTMTASKLRQWVASKRLCEA